eukprot:GGOE01046971.1.p1 GENE.GGOE01046971.1~~GGOE01046971.1.p1  ORF type:complete len:337 (+),score=117.92 GGOE01046971.1:79-1089(+)
MVRLVNPAANEQAMSLQYMDDPSLTRALNAYAASQYTGHVQYSATVANHVHFSDWRTHSIMEGIAKAQCQHEEQLKSMRVIWTIQRYMRGWLARRKYLRHKASLQAFVVKLQYQVQRKAAIHIQSVGRGFSARKLLKRLRAEEAARLEAENTKTKKKKKGPKGPVDPLQALMKDQQLFLKGMTAFLQFCYDDALSSFDKHLKKHQGERITERLMERCQAGKAAVLEQAKNEAEAKKAEAASKPAEGTKAVGKAPKAAALLTPEVSITNVNNEMRRSSAFAPPPPAASAAKPKGPARAPPGKQPQLAAADKVVAAPVAAKSEVPTLPQIKAPPKRTR